MIMDPRKLAIVDASTALKRAEWECFAVELRAKANALIEALIDDEDEIATRQALVDLALLNPVDHQFEIDTELYDARRDGPGEAEG